MRPGMQMQKRPITVLNQNPALSSSSQFVATIMPPRKLLALAKIKSSFIQIEFIQEQKTSNK
jgi:hypothetical protein